MQIKNARELHNIALKANTLEGSLSSVMNAISYRASYGYFDWKYTGKFLVEVEDILTLAGYDVITQNNECTSLVKKGIRPIKYWLIIRW